MSTYNFPPGLILPFNTGCPTGWTRLTSLDNRFPLGATVAAAGQSADVSTHTHTFDPPNVSASYTTNSYASQHGGYENGYNVKNYHKHSQYWDPVTSDSADHLPPHIKVVYCKKD